MVKRLRISLAIVGAAVLALGLTPGPAHAAPDNRPMLLLLPADGSPGPVALTGPAVDGPVSIAGACAPGTGVTVEAYGYLGCAKYNTHVMGKDWDGDGDYEYWVIAPSRTIWHIWDSSGGWREMPNDGRADDTHNAHWNGNGQRQVEVKTNTPNIWYSYYNGGWKGWYYYPGS